jgi:hypothetical protein
MEGVQLSGCRLKVHQLRTAKSEEHFVAQSNKVEGTTCCDIHMQFTKFNIYGHGQFQIFLSCSHFSNGSIKSPCTSMLRSRSFTLKVQMI